MICPHCHKPISDKKVAKHFASIGGKKSKRTISPEDRKKMQEGKKKKTEERKREEEGE